MPTATGATIGLRPRTTTGVAPRDGLARRRPPAGRALSASAERQSGKLHWLAVAFLIGLAIPWVIMIGPLRLSAYRLVLLAAIIPCLVLWAKGAAGKIRTGDIAMLGFCAWGAICLAVNQGLDKGFQSSGILFIESAGPYFLARCFIRDEDTFKTMILVVFWVVVCLLPFGLIETFTGYKAPLRLFGLVMRTIDETEMDIRWGLRRVQGPFEHPILFGVFCSGILSMAFLVLGYKQSAWKRWGRGLLVGGTSFLSLSSGPMSALVVQAMLLSWNRVLGRIAARWKILWVLVLGVYFGISVVTGKSPAAFYISHAPLFDAWSAYYRLLIWDNGTATVAHHPIFGIGLNEYERPSWMAASVDMFWLNIAIMFGLPGITLLALVFSASAAATGFQRILDEKLYTYRAAYLIGLAGFFIAGWGVHFWNGTYSYFLFLVGSGVWLAERGENRRNRRGDPPGPRPAAGRSLRRATSSTRPGRRQGRST